MRKWNVAVHWERVGAVMVCEVQTGHVSARSSAPLAAVRSAEDLRGILYGIREGALRALLSLRPPGATVWVPAGGCRAGYGGLVFSEAVEAPEGRYLLGCLIPQGCKLPEGAEVQL